MTPTLLASGLLIGMLVLCVLATMAVENWGRWRVRVVSPTIDAPAPPAVADQIDADGPEVDLTSIVAVDVDAGVPAPVEVWHVVDGRARADQLVGALFAAYAAARLPEAGRAAAWVSAVARPAGEEGREFEPGADLRGKPAAAERLLGCAVDGRTWVTLNPSVDIARGLSRRPPTCPTLSGLTTLWAATRAAMTRVPDDQLAVMRAAVAQLEPQWRGTPIAPDVESLLAAVGEAIDTDAALRVQVPLVPFAPPDAERRPVAVDARPSTPAGASTV